MSNSKQRHSYPPNQNQESDKYLPSFFVDVEIDGKIQKAEIRPLKQDKGYYTVNLGHIFLAHIRKPEHNWCNFFGNTNETYNIIGKAIDEWLEKI
jgi:hypothetical protein